jgi:hypothetical protein
MWFIQKKKNQKNKICGNNTHEQIPVTSNWNWYIGEFLESFVSQTIPKTISKIIISFSSLII